MENVNSMESTELVTGRIENKAATTSLIIAKAFGYDHSYLKRKIRNLNCNAEFKQQNFGEVPGIDKENDQLVRKYLITLDGFIKLGMSSHKRKIYSERLNELFTAFRYKQLCIDIDDKLEVAKKQIYIALESEFFC
ncbi:Rha family transcriptional regulator [Pontibacter korlensis]